MGRPRGEGVLHVHSGVQVGVGPVDLRWNGTVSGRVRTAEAEGNRPPSALPAGMEARWYGQGLGGYRPRSSRADASGGPEPRPGSRSGTGSEHLRPQGQRCRSRSRTSTRTPRPHRDPIGQAPRERTPGETGWEGKEPGAPGRRFRRRRVCPWWRRPRRPYPLGVSTASTRRRRKAPDSRRRGAAQRSCVRSAGFPWTRHAASVPSVPRGGSRKSRGWRRHGPRARRGAASGFPWFARVPFQGDRRLSDARSDPRPRPRPRGGAPPRWRLRTLRDPGHVAPPTRAAHRAPDTNEPGPLARRPPGSPAPDPRGP